MRAAKKNFRAEGIFLVFYGITLRAAIKMSRNRLVTSSLRGVPKSCRLRRLSGRCRVEFQPHRRRARSPFFSINFKKTEFGRFARFLHKVPFFILFIQKNFNFHFIISIEIVSCLFVLFVSFVCLFVDI